MSQSTFCQVPAGRIAYSRRGTGRPLVLLHPIGVDRSWWDEYVGHWAASYDVVTIDIRGHGDSSLVTAPITLADHATDIAAVLATSETIHGTAARIRYRALLTAAMRRIAAEPLGLSTVDRSKLSAGVRCFHIRHSRK